MKLNLHFLFSLVLLALTNGCMEDKTTKNCKEFGKGFRETCNKECPRKCLDILREKNAFTKISVEKATEVCTKSCAKHCDKTLEKVKPTQCKDKI